MNQVALSEIRKLKNQGVTDHKIAQSLSGVYESQEISECLEALQYMKPLEHTSLSGKRTTKGRKHNKQLIVVPISLVIFAFPLIVHVSLRQLTSRRIDTFSTLLEDKYTVEKSYYLGSTTECVRSGPTKFGQITGHHVCDLIIARLYYPRAEVQKVRGYDPISETHKEEVDRIYYVDQVGDSLRRYISFGVPIRQPSGRLHTPEEELGIGGFESLVFSGVSGHIARPEDKSIGGKWHWSSYDKFGPDSKGSKLMTSIDKKILADEPLARGAPTSSEALARGTAPLVVYFNFRYCNSPSIIGLDYLCILPYKSR
jgi:hypothetical protein